MGLGSRQRSPAAMTPQQHKHQRIRPKTLGYDSRGTHQTSHSVTLDYDVFLNVPRLEAKGARPCRRDARLRTSTSSSSGLCPDH